VSQALNYCLVVVPKNRIKVKRYLKNPNSGNTADSTWIEYTRQAIAVGKRHGAVSSIESYVPHLPKKCCKCGFLYKIYRKLLIFKSLSAKVRSNFPSDRFRLHRYCSNVQTVNSQQSTIILLVRSNFPSILSQLRLNSL
jgi:hypothetical protein